MFATCDDGLAEARLLLSRSSSASRSPELGFHSTATAEGQAGYFAVLRKTPAGGMSSRCFRMGQLDTVVHAMRRASDTYLSQGAFVAPHRQVQYLSHMRAAWVDLDCYNLSGAPSTSYIEDVVATARSIGLPAPSYIVRSGRGLYAKWVFENAIGAGQILQWKALQDALVAIYRSIGADAKAKDAARVLRALGTINSKVDTTTSPCDDRLVQVAWSSGELVDFNDLCMCAASAKFCGAIDGMASGGWDEEMAGAIELEESCGIEVAATTKERRLQAQQLRLQRALQAQMRIEQGLVATDVNGLQLFGDLRQPIMIRSRSTVSLNWARFLDLRNLAIQRGGIAQGWRTEYLFWMTTFLSHAQIIGRSNFWSEVKALASVIDPKGFDPIADGSMGTLYRKVSAHWERQAAAGSSNHAHKPGTRHPIYTASNAHLIELFQITTQEQSKLLTIIDSEEKSRRRDDKTEGVRERRERRSEVRAEVIRALDEGMPLRAISRELRVDSRQIRRIRDSRPASVESGGSADVGAPKRRRPATNLAGQLLNQLSDRILKGSSTRQICLELGLTESVVYRARKLLRSMCTIPQVDEAAAQAAAQSRAAIQAQRRLIADAALAAQARASVAKAEARAAQERLAGSVSAAKLMSRISKLSRSEPSPHGASAASADQPGPFDPGMLQDDARAAREALAILNEKAAHSQREADGLFAQLMGRMSTPPEMKPAEQGAAPSLSFRNPVSQVLYPENSIIPTSPVAAEEPREHRHTRHDGCAAPPEFRRRAGPVERTERSNRQAEDGLGSPGKSELAEIVDVSHGFCFGSVIRSGP